MISFIFGSICSVLALLALFDQDILMNFHIFPGFTALLAFGISGAIFAVSRGMIPSDYAIHHPEKLAEQIINEIHYYPPTWKSRLHTASLKKEFSAFFTYKFIVLGYEIASLLYMPFFLWTILPTKLESIVDFLDDVSVLGEDGYVCSLAAFNFEKHGNVEVSIISFPFND